MPEEYQDILMHNLTYLRKAHGLSQRQMAATLGIGPGSIRRIEQGIWPPNLPVSVLISVARHFGVRSYILLSRRLDEEGAPPA